MIDIEEYTNAFTKAIFKGEQNNKTNFAFAPLGAWINLAIYAKSFQSDLSQEQIHQLEKPLGKPIEAAHDDLKALYTKAPQFLSFALAFWHDGALESTYSQELYSKISTTVDALKNEVAKENKGSIEVHNALPSQKEIDTWVKDKSLSIMENFPEDVTNPDLEAIIANMIALKIDWDEPYEAVATPSTMESWGTQKVLYSKDDKHTHLKNYEGELYVIHTRSRHFHELGYSIEVSSIMSDTHDDERLYEVLNSYVNGTSGSSFYDIPLEDIKKLDKDYLNIEIVKKRAHEQKLVTHVHYPAWDIDYKKDLNETEGFDLFAQYFATLEEQKELLNFQVVKSSYHKDGYEAAALTYGMMTRASMVFPPETIVEDVHVDVLFNKPFISMTAIKRLPLSKDNYWFHGSLFVSKVQKASEINS